MGEAREIGRTLRRLRLAKGLTQRQLAEPEYTHPYVSIIEAGKRRPSDAALAVFARKLHVQPVDILTGRPPGLERELDRRLREARIRLSAGETEEAERAAQVVLGEAGRFDLPRTASGARLILGLLREREGRPEEALLGYETAEELLASEPASLHADAVAGQARCLEALGDVGPAIDILERLVARLRSEHGTSLAFAQAYASLLDAYLEAGMQRQAEEVGGHLRQLRARIRDPIRVGQVEVHLAHLDLALGDFDAVEHALEVAERAYSSAGLKTEVAEVWLARGYVLTRRGRPAQARRELQRALALFEETGNLKDTPRTLNELARVERLTDHADRAVELLQRSISLLADTDAPILAWAHRELGLTHLGAEPALAEKHLREALELFDRAGERVEAAVTYRALGDLLRDQGEPEAAFAAYRAGIHGLDGDS